MMKTSTGHNFVQPSSWQGIPYGEFYQRAIESQLSPWLKRIFGNHLLKLGALSFNIDTGACGINHQINLACSGTDLDLLGDYYQLPLQSKCIDGCLVAHLLPYVMYPHQLFREIDRILVDDGWLLLSTFNPLSLLGLGKVVPVVKNKKSFAFYSYHHFRLVDWLTLLNYEIVYDRGFQLLPWSRGGGGRFLNEHLPAMGCLNVMVARKRTIPLTLSPLHNRQYSLRWRQGVASATNCSDSRREHSADNKYHEE